MRSRIRLGRAKIWQGLARAARPSAGERRCACEGDLLQRLFHRRVAQRELIRIRCALATSTQAGRVCGYVYDNSEQRCAALPIWNHSTTRTASTTASASIRPRHVSRPLEEPLDSPHIAPCFLSLAGVLRIRKSGLTHVARSATDMHISARHVYFAQTFYTSERFAVISPQVKSCSSKSQRARKGNTSAAGNAGPKSVSLYEVSFSESVECPSSRFWKLSGRKVFSSLCLKFDRSE